MPLAVLVIAQTCFSFLTGHLWPMRLVFNDFYTPDNASSTQPEGYPIFAVVSPIDGEDDGTDTASFLTILQHIASATIDRVFS
jgi:hypothetical protein